MLFLLRGLLCNIFHSKSPQFWYFLKCWWVYSTKLRVSIWNTRLYVNRIAVDNWPMQRVSLKFFLLNFIFQTSQVKMPAQKRQSCLISLLNCCKPEGHCSVREFLFTLLIIFILRSIIFWSVSKCLHFLHTVDNSLFDYASQCHAVEL